MALSLRRTVGCGCSSGSFAVELLLGRGKGGDSEKGERRKRRLTQDQGGSDTKGHGGWVSVVRDETRPGWVRVC